MRGSIRLLALWALGVLLCEPLPGQVTPGQRDSVKNRPAGDSLRRHPDSSSATIMTVDSVKAKEGAAGARLPEVRTPRSSTLRTVERQTASHAAKNAPRVKNARPTTR